MNKLFTKIATLALGAAMAFGVGVAVASNSKEAMPVHAATSASATLTVSSASPTWSDSGDTHFTVTLTKNSGDYDPKYANTYIHLYAGTYVTIAKNSSYSGTISISQIVVSGKCAKSGKTYTTRYSSDGTLTTSGGTAITYNSTSYATKTYTFNNVSSAIIYNAGAGAVYFESMAVTYTYQNAQSYTLSFDANGGSGSVPSNITGSGSKTLPSSAPNLSKTGYTLDGWGDSSHKDNASAQYALGASYTLNDNITLYAHWTANKYDISYYDQGGGTFSGSHESGYPTKHTYGTATTLKSATKGGYNFDGWFTTSACTGSAVTSLGATAYTAAISLYAKWTVAGTTYSISTTVTNGSYSGDTSITDNGGVASVTISPTGDFKLPASVSVSGADHTYNDSTGVISLSNATGNVTISAAMVALTEYSITVNETNGTHTGASTIKESRTASLTFTPSSGFGQPADVTVSGATKSWVRDTGVLTLSNPTGNVSVTYTATANELTSITLSATSGSYTLGDAFVKPTVTAHYNVASDANVTSSATYSGYDPYTTGNHAVTISYTEGGITKTASYTATVSAKSVGYSYDKISSVSDITEGDYIIAYSSYGFDGRDAGEGYTSVSVSNDSIAGTAAMDKLAVHIVPVTGGYTMQLSSTNDNNPSKYVTFTSNSNSLSFADEATTVSIAAATSSTHLAYAEGGYAIGDSSTYLSWNSNSGSSNQRYRFYKVSTTTNSNNNTGLPYKAPELYKKISSGTADLIRITATYKGGDKFVGDPISTSDFTVKKQLNTGNELTDVASGYTISANTLTAESNSITVSYTEGGVTKTATVVVSATEREASLEHVVLNIGENAKLDGYVYWSGAVWDLADITVTYDWDDDDFDETVDLQDLVNSGDATLSPATPTLGATSFTVSYSYLEKNIENATVTLDEAVIADYVSSVSWTGKSLSHFKAFSGGQLTSTTVSGWTVKATYAGAGESNALSFGTGANQFTIRIGDSKAVTSLPYTWTTADDNQFVYVVVGGVAKGDSTHAKTNICASINDINHTEIVTPAWEEDVEAYVKVSDVDDVTTGRYLIVYEGDSTHHNAAYDGSLADGSFDANLNFKSITFDGGNIEIPESDNFYVTITKNTDDYTITSASGVNIGHSTGSNGFNKTGNNTISFNNDGTVNITGTGGIKFQYNYANKTERFRYYASSQGAVCLYKYVNETIPHEAVTETTNYANDMEHFDAQKKVVEFAKFMNTTMNGTNVCSGTFANLESAWDDVADKYDELFGASTTLNETELAWAKNMLKYATAAWGSDDELACVEKAMKTYEYCSAKYELDGFMSELRSGKVVNPVSILSESTNTITIVIVTSMIGLTAVGGYFFLRKRKENI